MGTGMGGVGSGGGSGACSLVGLLYKLAKTSVRLLLVDA